MRRKIKKEKNKPFLKVIDPTPPPDEDEMKRLNKQHYDAQMEIVVRLYGYKEKGLSVEAAARKVGLASSYVLDVYDHDVVYMKKLWSKLFHITENDND